ncbi:TPA: PTS sugar transporter subunit IIA [Listeria monocytogenes]|nr:PTS sugar transporter subunit IIA [Listeria monocytogenes]
MLLDRVTLEDIEVNLKAKDWREAIQTSARLLLERGAIKESYIDGMIQSVENNGPYIVIAKHIALAHTRPEFGVIRGGLTFATLADGVAFGSDMFDPVKLVAATDSESHLEVLSELAEVLMDEEKVTRLIEANSSQAFYDELTKEG